MGMEDFQFLLGDLATAFREDAIWNRTIVLGASASTRSRRRSAATSPAWARRKSGSTATVPS